jgi:hypothetical protein
MIIIIIISLLGGLHEFEQAGQFVSSLAPNTPSEGPGSLEDRSRSLFYYKRIHFGVIANYPRQLTGSQFQCRRVRANK